MDVGVGLGFDVVVVLEEGCVYWWFCVVVFWCGMGGIIGVLWWLVCGLVVGV